MEGEEEIQEVVEKPESMLSPKVQQILIEVVDRETEKALKDGDHAYAMELQRAKKLVERGCWSVRRANPFLDHMAECLLGKGGDLETTQKAMKECSQKWRELPIEKKKELKALVGELSVYDYL